MDTLTLVLAILGWSTLINIGLLAFSTVVVLFFADSIEKIHQKWFGIETGDLRREYFRYLANYKILILVLNLVPYLAIRMAMN